MRTFEYHVVDVFTQAALEGNPLAVFPDAGGLDGSTMQRIARELSLSETTFVLPPTHPDAAAKVRIFTPSYEMPFAGHPTIGTAHVLRNLGIVPNALTHFALEEQVGLVPVRVDENEGGLLWLTTPRISEGAVFDRERCAEAIGVPIASFIDGVACRLLSAGNPQVFMPLKDAAAVDAANLDPAKFQALVAAETRPACAFVFAPAGTGAYSRMFAPALGIIEDPATGSATGPLALYMMNNGLVSNHDGTRFISEQGTKMGRRSLLHVRIRGENGVDGIEVGGHTTHFASATATIV